MNKIDVYLTECPHDCTILSKEEIHKTKAVWNKKGESRLMDALFTLELLKT